MPKTVDDAASILVLGATGSFGAAVALELLSRGSSTRLFVRDLERARRRFGNRANAQYVVGDALDDAALSQAMAGCSAVISGLNLDESDQLRQTTRLLELLSRASARTGADAASRVPVLIIPAWPTEAESLHGDGSVRDAAAKGNVSLVILSTGPLFGPTVRHGVIDRACRAALEWKTIPGLGDLDAPSPWTFAPDAARVAAEHATWAGNGIEGSPRLVHCDPYPVSQREFLNELGSRAIRLTLPPGADVQSLNGQAQPRIGTMSSLSMRLACWRDRSFRQAVERFQACSPRKTERSGVSAPAETLGGALTRTLTSYRQGAL